MSRRLAAVLFGFVVASLCVGCQQREAPPPTMPTIPPGFESKPGFGGMDQQKAEPQKEATDQKEATKEAAATDQEKAAAPEASAEEPSGDAPAGAGVEKTGQ